MLTEAEAPLARVSAGLPDAPPCRVDVELDDGDRIGGTFHTDRAQATRSFRRFADLAADTVCFGHDRPLRGPETRMLREAASAEVVPDPMG
ncbi:MAG: hypothetical protein L0I76_10880 [Pseudonocardia sp.]|nr:hypothetical protein [Pseudonocardia sp.]